MHRVVGWIKGELVLTIAWAAAIVTMFFVPISKDYVGYLNFSVLSVLFCLMAVVAGLLQTGVFDVLAQRLLSRSDSSRGVALLLVCACFFSAMLVTNDVALLTFVPFTLGILGAVEQKQVVFVLTLETVAANLGSMLTPIGNPQNLYLYSFYQMTPRDFFRTVGPVCAAGFLILVALVLRMPGGTMRIRFCEQARLRDKRLLLCCMLLFFLSILTVLHRVDFRSSLAITVVALLLLDKTIFCRVDYSLLLTFVAFFVFVGNLGRLPSIQTMVSSLMTGREFLAGVLLSQLISNVPAAVMLSGFTDQARALLLGVNVGGLGTLVASLASLISFRLYAKSEHAQPGLFIRVFTAYNGLILLLLIAVVWILPQ